MTTRVNPPSLTKSKNYERFKQEVLAWSEITELKRDKQGIAVALSLPEEDENQIKDKVFDQIPIDDLKDDSGLDILLAFLDKHLGKDDLADSLDKFEDFDEFSRKDGQIKIDGAERDAFDFPAALHNWKTCKDRRLYEISYFK